MDVLHVIFTIGVGALIGYCTNFIAIKMMFRPRKEVRVFGKRLPFTPGMIPMNLSRIAKAVGTAVGEQLLTSEDVMQVLQSEKVRGGFVSGVSQVLCSEEGSLQESLESLSLEVDVEHAKDQVADQVATQLLDSIQQLDFGELFGKVGVDVFADMRKNPMIAMIVNDTMISNIAAKLGQYVTVYLEEHGKELMMPVLKEKVDTIFSQSIGTTLHSFQITDEMVENVAGKLFDQFVTTKCEELFAKLDVSSMVEEKICKMDMNELENLVMSVMKKELQSVINLGALIGAVIGMLNLL